MKHILITGVNSYIGNCVERYLMEYNSKQGREFYRVDRISLREENWKIVDFSRYDTILHMVGIAHADIGKVTEEEKQRYYQINCDLAVQTAEKAKREGVKQFVYMSSVIVYGNSAKVGEKKHITVDTLPSPANFYGDSKWLAEQKLGLLEDKNFHMAIIRTPMIYGKDSKGNFRMLEKIAGKTPCFPSIENKRSMLYVENLAEFLRLLLESGKGGIFFPQNKEYVTTSQMVKAIGIAKGKKICLLGILNPFVKLASKIPGKISGMADKAFGSLTIDKGLSNCVITGYQVYSLEESIGKCVK